MSRKGLQQPNIVPYSISVISNNPDVSSVSFAGLFDDKRGKQQSGEYRIKVKRPYENSHGQQMNTPTKSNTGERTVNYEFDLSPSSQSNQPIITPEVIPLSVNTTGYEICKTSFSEQQILQAFKVLDVNKDQLITEQDIMFFLQYIKQPYTNQQVKQMIRMVSGDGKKVTWQEFKKVGKGSIIPFADIKVPDDANRKKKRIYQNISNNQSLYEENSSIILSASQNEIISMKKFQQSKKLSTLPLEIQLTKTIDQQEQLQFLTKHIPLLAQDQFQLRRQLFCGLQMVNVTEVVRSYKLLVDGKSSISSNKVKDKSVRGDSVYQGNNPKGDNYNSNGCFVDYKGVAKILEINQKQAKLLYAQTNLKQSPTQQGRSQKSNPNILIKRVALQAIAYSQLNKIKKLELAMLILLKKNTINFDELYFLLQVLKGKDQMGSLRKKLLTVLKSKNISKDQEINKFYVLELINTYSYQFNF